MAILDYSMTTAAQFVGRELGTSDWTPTACLAEFASTHRHK
jgi:hypothetical protein